MKTRPLLLAVACSFLAFHSYGQQQKKKVAVLNFDYGTVSSGVAAIFNTNVDVGRGLADLVVGKLVNDGIYAVYERKAIDKIMTEQNMSNSDRFDASSAARLGRLIGVDAIVIGSITQFGRDDKTTTVGGGGLSRITGRYGIGNVGKRESKAVVGVSARLVSVDTAEVLATAQGHGESSRSGATLLGSGGSSSAAGGGLYDMSSKNFAATLIGEATTNAVNTLVRQLEDQAGRVPTRVANIDGLVADVNGSTVILNVGNKVGVRPGMHLFINRTLRTVKDPATGKVIRRLEDKIGEVEVSEVDENSAVAKWVSGSGTPQVGDTVRNNQ